MTLHSIEVNYHRVDGTETFHEVVTDRELESWRQNRRVQVGKVRPATWQDLAEYLDMQLEAENYHSLCGVHDALGQLLVKEASEEVALKVLTRVYESGGVTGYSGWRHS